MILQRERFPSSPADLAIQLMKSLAVMERFIVFLFLTCSTCALAQPFIDPSLLSNTVYELIEKSLKRSEMQSYLDTLHFKLESSVSEKAIDLLADVMAKKLQATRSALLNLRKASKDSFSQSHGNTTSPPKCCNFVNDDNLKYDKRFNTKVNLQDACRLDEYFTAQNPMVSHNTKLAAQPFLDQSVRNVHSFPFLTWQYFVAKNGKAFIHPSTRTACYDGDSKWRPWYVKACLSKSKHVVIVFDKSGSMLQQHEGVTRLELVKQAVKSVVSTLNYHDKFAVIAFSNLPQVVVGITDKEACIVGTMTQATPKNIKLFYNSLERITAGGSAVYGRALAKALQLLEDQYNPNDGQSTESILLFMSDSEPYDSARNIIQTLLLTNRVIKVRPHIFFYGLDNADLNILRMLASNESLSYGKGKFVAVPNPSVLAYSMGTYFQHFANERRNTSEIVWSGPYKDTLGLGYLMAASLPVFYNEEFVGVCGIDLTVNELFIIAQNFHPNEFSYAFVTDSSGYIFTHPMFSYDNFEETSFLLVDTLEADQEFVEIFESIKRGENGSKTFDSTKFIRNEDYPNTSVRKKLVSATYVWRKLPHSTFFVFFVLGMNGSYFSSHEARSKPFPRGAFVSQRIDLLPPRSPCFHLGFLSSKNETLIHLSARAFNEPDRFLLHTLTEKDIINITDYLEGRGPNTFGLTELVKEDILATFQLQDLWINQKLDLKQYIFYRYIATTHGVYRAYPGLMMEKDYDPTKRPWYENSISRRNKYMVSAPYADKPSGMLIVTLTCTLLRRASKEAKPEESELFGVMGVDIIMNYFNELFEDLYKYQPNSRYYKTYVMNGVGYMIIAEEYKRIKNENFRLLHVTEVEPFIARLLIIDKVLQRVNCSQVETAKLHKQYTISLNFSYHQATYEDGSTGCLDFSLVSVPKTNMFILVRSRFNAPCVGVFERISRPCYCSSDKICQADSGEADDCQCTCFGKNPHYIPCLNSYVSLNRTFGEVPSPCIPTRIDTQAEKRQVYRKEPVCYELLFQYSESREAEVISSICLLAASLLSFIIISVYYNVRRERDFHLKQQESEITKSENWQKEGPAGSLVRSFLASQDNVYNPQAVLSHIAAAYYLNKHHLESNSAAWKTAKSQTATSSESSLEAITSHSTQAASSFQISSFKTSVSNTSQRFSNVSSNKHASITLLSEQSSLSRETSQGSSTRSLQNEVFERKSKESEDEESKPDTV